MQGCACSSQSSGNTQKSCIAQVGAPSSQGKPAWMDSNPQLEREVSSWLWPTAGNRQIDVSYHSSKGLSGSQSLASIRNTWKAC